MKSSGKKKNMLIKAKKKSSKEKVKIGVMRKKLPSLSLPKLAYVSAVAILVLAVGVQAVVVQFQYSNFKRASALRYGPAINASPFYGVAYRLCRTPVTDPYYGPLWKIYAYTTKIPDQATNHLKVNLMVWRPSAYRWIAESNLFFQYPTPWWLSAGNTSYIFASRAPGSNDRVRLNVSDGTTVSYGMEVDVNSPYLVYC